jgi:hypothetical protein
VTEQADVTGSNPVERSAHCWFKSSQVYHFYPISMGVWQIGDAMDCKSLEAGSNPVAPFLIYLLAYKVLVVAPLSSKQVERVRLSLCALTGVWLIWKERGSAKTEEVGSNPTTPTISW